MHSNEWNKIAEIQPANQMYHTAQDDGEAQAMSQRQAVLRYEDIFPCYTCSRFFTAFEQFWYDIFPSYWKSELTLPQGATPAAANRFPLSSVTVSSPHAVVRVLPTFTVVSLNAPGLMGDSGIPTKR